jgi:hypothetical protein
MDCEKLESALMDELYGELDELTRASVKRHVAGCTRCAALLGGLQATRRLASVPQVAPPAGLEARILEATSRAMPATAPVRRRLASIVSIAGSWAMRPQTAMAALFLVTLGTSVLLMHGRSSRAPAIAPVTVVEEGSPAPAAASAPAAENAPPPYYASASAVENDGRGEPAPRDRQGALAAKPSGHAALSDNELATRDDVAERSVGVARKSAAAPAMPSPGGGGGATAGARAEWRFATAPAAAPADAPMSAPMAAAAPAPASPVAAEGTSGTAVSPFDAAMAAYRAKRFDDARRGFEALAAADPNADLWAARSVRESRGCGAAAARFDQVARRATGTSTGWQAQLDGARCHASLGDADGARARLRPLLGVDAFRDRAQTEIDRLSGAAP